MTDKNKLLHARAAEISQPTSPLESVISTCRNAYRVGPTMADLGDAISMAGVFLVALTILMFLAVSSRAGGAALPAFFTGIFTGTLVGVLFWWYDQCGRSGRDTSSHS
ncbi:MAG: hypothetical protein EHM55_18895 [Acidobacteria bacterium]|nr:MAG: hypothetical protein EHM55_18895 [Acidobacteriota bacterium]